MKKISLRKQLFAGFSFLAAATVLLTMVFAFLVYEQIFHKNMYQDLEKTASLMIESGALDQLMTDRRQGGAKGYRVTVMNTEGKVLYDNYTEADRMENQLYQPEVLKALGNGEGRSYREADDERENWYWYAFRPERDIILRLGKTGSSIADMAGTGLPYLLVLTAALVVAGVILGGWYTGRSIAPIRRLAQNPDRKDETVYEEIRPLIQCIEKQHAEIRGSMERQEAFTANVTHELKTPLTSISGYAQLLELGENDPEAVALFGKSIHENADRLLAMIQDILSLSELDASTDGTWEREVVDLYETAKNVISGFQMQASLQSVHLVCSGMPFYIRANRKMMRQMVTNLVDNAIRYNEEGGSVWVEVNDRLDVRDTGIGIAEEEREKVFERFYRVDKDESRRRGGTGLGLSIVKEIAQLHGAEITVSGIPGAGTAVSVLFPEDMVVKNAAAAEGESNV